MLQPNFTPFPELITERLLLRKIKKEDAAEFFKLRSNEEVMKFIGKERARSIKDAEIFIDMMIEAANKNEGITWAITIKEAPSVLIGTIGLWRLIKEHYRAEVGYMLHPSFWKKRIITEALQAVINFGWNTLLLHSIEALIDPSNTASEKLLQSAGFVKEAHFKENFFFNGVFLDTAVYSLINTQ